MPVHCASLVFGRLEHERAGSPARTVRLGAPNKACFPSGRALPIFAGMTDQDPRSFLYRPGQLDPETAQRITGEVLNACDDGELYLQYSANESLVFDDGRLKVADYSMDSGFGLRGISGEITGFAHAN